MCAFPFFSLYSASLLRNWRGNFMVRETNSHLSQGQNYSAGQKKHIKHFLWSFSRPSARLVHHATFLISFALSHFNGLMLEGCIGLKDTTLWSMLEVKGNKGCFYTVLGRCVDLSVCKKFFWWSCWRDIWGTEAVCVWCFWLNTRKLSFNCSFNYTWCDWRRHLFGFLYPEDEQGYYRCIERHKMQSKLWMCSMTI